MAVWILCTKEVEMGQRRDNMFRRHTRACWYICLLLIMVAWQFLTWPTWMAERHRLTQTKTECEPLSSGWRRKSKKLTSIRGPKHATKPGKFSVTAQHDTARYWESRAWVVRFDTTRSSMVTLKGVLNWNVGCR